MVHSLGTATEATHEHALSTRTYLVGTVLTLADCAVFAQLMSECGLVSGWINVGSGGDVRQCASVACWMW